MTHNDDIERAGDELHSIDDTMTAAGDRKAIKDENNLPIRESNSFEATDYREVLHDVPAGIVLPPFPGADAVERKPFSAEQILDINPDLTTKQLKDRFRFCQEKIDCCREMLESIITVTSQTNDMIEHYNCFVSPLLGMQKVPSDYQSKPFALKCLVLLRRMEDLEDLPLHDLFLLHDTYEDIASSVHTSTESDHNLNCKFYDV